LTEVGDSLSSGMALIYIFNLIVGTGALTMPKAVAGAGWLVSQIMILVIAFMSYLTATFTIEALSCANAKDTWNKRQKMRKKQDRELGIDAGDDISASVSSEERPLLPDAVTERQNGDTTDYFEIKQRIEMGQMASMFFNKIGLNAFYIIIIVYLYGDLAIYAAAVPKSVRDVVCSYDPNNVTSNATTPLSESMRCFNNNPTLSRFHVYQIFLTVFFICMAPFTFFDVQKTKYLQICTSALRWISFTMMIVIALVRLGQGTNAHPKMATGIKEIPSLFGACIYSFMCHHSLPSLISPVKDKEKINLVMLVDYVFIMGFYVLVTMTAVFAFPKLEDLYTLNFSPHNSQAAQVPPAWVWVKYFIALFPVFTISASFPIIAITLRNNLKTLFQRKGKPYHRFVDRVVFPLVTVVPPTIIVYFTCDVKILVAITGAYAGAGIQYLLPAFLVFKARKEMASMFGAGFRNKHHSPFKHGLWVWLVVGWCLVALVFVTWDLIAK